jgi:hypothetical protein
MKALFLGTPVALQAEPIIEFITANIRTEILDNNKPAQAAAALANADVLLTGVWRNGFPAAPKLCLLQVPLAGMSLRRQAARHAAALGGGRSNQTRSLR